MDEVKVKTVSSTEMARRIVRYGELRPCFNAFVDTRTPGSEAKENFTIIGPGVSENPAQYVHITEPHGYNIGGARQPPNCVNSQHSHETAEVFVAHTGHWRFDLGEDCEDAHVYLGPGDLVSLPPGAFRGFTNVGDDVGFLWAILGEDDPGRVTWAPKVFELAKNYGLMLMENGRLVDTVAGETPPPGVAPLAPTTKAQAAAMKHISQVEADAFVVRQPDKSTQGEVQLIGPKGMITAPHGFIVTRRTIAAGGRLASESHDCAMVVFVHTGSLAISWQDGSVVLGPGDTMTVPSHLHWSMASKDGAIVFTVLRSPAA
jgi:mannose-6-phosphate isomerase-like protein (cupin superfamily)